MYTTLPMRENLSLEQQLYHLKKEVKLFLSSVNKINKRSSNVHDMTPTIKLPMMASLNRANSCGHTQSSGNLRVQKSWTPMNLVLYLDIVLQRFPAKIFSQLLAYRAAMRFNA